MGGKAKLGKKLLKGAVGVASALGVPGAGLLDKGMAIAGAFGGASKGARGTKPKKGEPGYKPPRRKGIMYYMKRIPVEKAKARLTRIKMSAYKGL